MEKEKKGIKCSYALLVIILFATVCFLTDYIVIERKTRVNKCPKCENTCTKCDVKEENSVVEESNQQIDTSNNNRGLYSSEFCIEQTSDYCLVKNDNDLKVEIKVEPIYNNNYVLYLNGNSFLPKFDYVGAIVDLQFLDDGYIYVQYDVQGLGPEERAFIIDSLGNEITRTTSFDYHLGGRDHTSINFKDGKLKLINFIFGDGGLGVVCESEQRPEYNDVVSVEYNFDYIGNGKLKETNHIKKTFAEYLKEKTGYSTCNELLNR